MPLIDRDFAELIKKYGRESVAKSVAVELLTKKHISVAEIVKYTGLSTEEVKRLKTLDKILTNVFGLEE